MGVLALHPGRDPHAWLVTLDARDGTLLGVVDTTRSCTDGEPGPMLTSSDLVRGAIEGQPPPEPRQVETCYSSTFDEYFLEDHRSDAALLCYDAEGDADPMNAALWYSTCLEPTCYTYSTATNDWTAGKAAQRASDFRTARKVLDLFEQLFGRVGADGDGENLILASGMSYDNARSMGMYRTIAIRARPTTGDSPVRAGRAWMGCASRARLSGRPRWLRRVKGAAARRRGTAPRSGMDGWGPAGRWREWRRFAGAAGAAGLRRSAARADRMPSRTLPAARRRRSRGSSPR